MVKIKMISDQTNLKFYSIDSLQGMEIPYFEARVSAGFPSPAEDYTDIKLDLNKALIQNPTATFYVKVKGMSMQNAGILEGDMLVVDRSVLPTDQCIAICVINSEFTVKRIKKTKSGLSLIPENPDFKAIKITSDMDFSIWGVVTYVVHKV
ncbi:MAG: translesion error-prone DNA polymerase V autoproteolytic subunit [Bacteroidota bacterium]|jgi:DNA polymerase V